MAYVLERLLNVRVLREKKAQDGVIKANAALEQAIEAQKEREKELEEYKQWRAKEEERLYNEVIDKQIKRIDVGALNSQLMNLAKKETEHEMRIEEAKKEVQAAKKTLEDAKVVYKATLLQLKKLEEHKEVWMDIWTKKQNLILEREMEEFRVRTQYSL